MTLPDLARLTPTQHARLEAEPDLRAAFEAGLAPFLPKFSGVCWSGMTGDRWVPVEAVFENAVRKVRWDRNAAQTRQVAA